MSRQQTILDNLPLVQGIAHNIHHSKLPSGMDEEDLVQSGYEGLIQAVDRYDADKGSFKPYAVRRIKGAMLDNIRTMQHSNRGQPHPEIASINSTVGIEGDTYADIIPDTRAVMHPDYIDLWDMVERLDHCARVVIKHYYWREIRLSDIGRRLGITEGRVSQIKSRALKQMRAVL
jgi:RNA polymerase sigma factor for flagellar operon FliA